MNITSQKEKYSDCLYELDFGGGGGGPHGFQVERTKWGSVFAKRVWGDYGKLTALNCQWGVRERKS